MGAPISVCLLFLAQPGTILTDGKIACCRGSLSFCRASPPPGSVFELHASTDTGERSLFSELGRVGVCPVTTSSFWTAIWLILPVVICLSQRLSHACLSTS